MLLIPTGLMLGCRNNSARIAARDNLSGEKQTLSLLLMPSDSANQVYNGLKKRTAVIEFYRQRNNRSAWIENTKLSMLGDSMVMMIRNIRYYGLRPENYNLNEIEDQINSSDTQNNLLRIDALLTDDFFLIADDLKYGRLRDIPETDSDSLRISLLQEVLDGCGLRKGLALQEPQFSRYHSLKKALKVSLDTLEEEERKSFLTGDLNDTLPLEKKIKSIEINLDRWRSEENTLGNRYILINIPSFKLQVISNDSVVLESKIIVGKPDKPTPLLSSTIECITIYPYWHVPRKISVEEYLPTIKEDPSFLIRNDFEVLDRSGQILDPDSVAWQNFNKNYFPVTLRQREGPENSLGVLKFVFENPYAVYLHDTNAKRLFKNEIRAFSHGCIRVEKAVELAHYLVTNDIHRKSKTIENYLKEKQRHTVDLQNPIPIHVRYFTCEFKDNVFYQYGDLYGQDQKLIDLIYK